MKGTAASPDAYEPLFQPHVLPHCGFSRPSDGLTAAPPPGSCCARAQTTPFSRLSPPRWSGSVSHRFVGAWCPGAAARGTTILLETRWASLPGMRVLGAPSLRDILAGSWRPEPLSGGRGGGSELPSGTALAVGFFPFPLTPGPTWLEEWWPRGQEGISGPDPTPCRSPHPCRPPTPCRPPAPCCKGLTCPAVGACHFLGQDYF